MVGIYKIQNLINGKIYIGQSVNIEKRWQEEKNRAFQISAHEYDYPLSRAFRKYGIENFSFEIIEECKREELNSREKYWIAHYNSFLDGYNQTLGGDTSINTKKEKIVGIITDLENTDMYHKEIAAKWEISIEMVQGINTGRYWHQENKDYPLQKKHKVKSNHIIDGKYEEKTYQCAECGKPISRQATLCVECAKIKSRKVERPSANELKDYLISINGNFSKASRHYGVTDNAIRKWCRAYNLPTHSSDYKK